MEGKISAPNPDISRLHIRPMTASDLDFAASLTAGEKWVTETREEFEGFLEHDPAGCWVGELEGCRAAVCVATLYGERGFVGEMIVVPGLRPLGLGRRLFGHVLDDMRRRGCRSVSLDAVPRAAAYYESVGFRPVCRSLRLTKGLSPEPAEGVRSMARSDLDEILAVDRRAFGADRSFFLRRRLTLYPELASVQVEKSVLTGYLFGRRRGRFAWAGPWWVRPGASDPGGLLRAFGLGTDAPDLLLGVLDSNPSAVSVTRALGLRERGHASIRMVLGDPAAAVGFSPELMGIGSAAKG